MTTIADRIVEIARAEVGTREVPMGSNTGPRVIEYQHATPLDGTGWPWCAAFVEWCWESAGLTDHPANPSTFWMCKIAAARAELSDSPRIGGAIIWCGTHTGIVVGLGAGVVFTVEGNAGDQVAAKTRAVAGARFVNPKGLDTALVPPRLYWIDDPGATFVIRGPWAKLAYAENAKSKLSDALQRRAEILRTGTGTYVMRIGEKPRRGPFLDITERDRVMAILSASLGRPLIPRSTESDLPPSVPAPIPSGPAEGLGKTQ